MSKLHFNNSTIEMQGSIQQQDVSGISLRLSSILFKNNDNKLNTLSLSQQGRRRSVGCSGRVTLKPSGVPAQITALTATHSDAIIRRISRTCSEKKKGKKGGEGVYVPFSALVG